MNDYRLFCKLNRPNPWSRFADTPGDNAWRNIQQLSGFRLAGWVILQICISCKICRITLAPVSSHRHIRQRGGDHGALTFIHMPALPGAREDAAERIRAGIRR